MFCCYILFSYINWVILVFIISVHVTFINATTFSSLSKHSWNYHLILTRVVFLLCVCQDSIRLHEAAIALQSTIFYHLTTLLFVTCHIYFHVSDVTECFRLHNRKAFYFHKRSFDVQTYQIIYLYMRHCKTCPFRSCSRHIFTFISFSLAFVSLRNPSRI